MPVFISIPGKPEKYKVIIPMTGSERTPLARLVLFMVCLSIAGAFIAGVHYAAVDLPQQNSLTAPTNAKDITMLLACLSGCIQTYPTDVPHTQQVLWAQVDCKNACFDKYYY